ncbi:hypothetical protein [Halarcobacter sp.]|uniref:hypothetical protein n=1 Tax=Halarcobacter sp. TaxID=2321133 RepID=UPI002AA8077A|nr:hypothetical protein [Halarcobacter sp.]
MCIAKRDSLYSGDPYESGDDGLNNNYNLNSMASQYPGIESGLLGPIDFVIGAAIAIPAKYLGLVTKTSPKIVKSFQSRRAALRAAKRDRGLPTSQTHISHKKI